MGARAVGMGEAFTAVADDATANFWNPAGLMLSRGTGLSFTHGEWFEGITDEYLAFSSNLGRFGAIGGSVQFFNSGTFPGALEGPGGIYGGVGETISYTGDQASAAYAQRLGNWIPGDFFKKSLLGIKFSAVGESIASLNTSGFSVDVGYMYEAIRKTLFLATVVSNIGSDIQTFSEPLNYKLAGSLRLHEVLMKRDQNIIAMETAGYMDSGLGFKVGDEYRLNFDDNAVALRLGYRIGNSLSDVTNLTAGAGIYHQFPGVEISLDYAFVPYSILGNTHRITFNIIEGGNTEPVSIKVASASTFVLGQEKLEVALMTKSEQPIASWRVNVLDDTGRLVETMTGKGAPPNNYSWDGKNLAGELVPEGKYSITMEATDEDDQSTKSNPCPVTAQWVAKKVPYQYAYGVPGDLLFESGKADLLPAGYETIQKAAIAIHAKYPNSVIQIAGHTDNVKLDGKGKFKDNQALSLARAKSVVDFLFHSGMNEDQLSAVGYGDTKPIAPNDTPENRAKNRRVELIVSGATEVTATELIEEGQRLMASKNHKEALPVFLKALESDSRNAMAFQMAGNCYLMLGAKDQAIQAYLLALRYNPNNEALRNWLKTYAPNAVPTPTAVPVNGLPTLPGMPIN
jgi:flagellar motor protein MotB